MQSDYLSVTYPLVGECINQSFLINDLILSSPEDENNLI